ncbi:hypothetical protein [Halocatena halophila]|uniref:hypothetical protein n=1 Tax=Halocatena halophila TaxID=2814576 RepID=UPI002ED3DD39
METASIAPRERFDTVVVRVNGSSGMDLHVPRDGSRTLPVCKYANVHDDGNWTSKPVSVYSAGVDEWCDECLAEFYEIDEGPKDDPEPQISEGQPQGSHSDLDSEEIDADIIIDRLDELAEHLERVPTAKEWDNWAKAPLHSMKIEIHFDGASTWTDVLYQMGWPVGRSHSKRLRELLFENPQERTVGR